MSENTKTHSEIAVEARQIASQTVEHLCKWRMDIKVILSLYVVSSELHVLSDYIRCLLNYEPCRNEPHQSYKRYYR